jgi:RHH-type rel operon transcriptional repressor/antitoxin RelB
MNTCIQKQGVLKMATSIRLAPETEQRLDYLAAQTGRTKAYYLREIIEQGIEDMEDYYLAFDVLERIRKGQEKVHSSAELRRDLGLEN